MLERDVILSKISIVQNCLKTIKRVTGLKPEKLQDPIFQDVFVLNVQRAVQACIYMAHVLIAQKGLRLPASYKDSFLTLAKENIVSVETAEKMIKMVGFRNISIHEYQKVDINILKAILKDHLGDFEDFYTQVYNFQKE